MATVLVRDFTDYSRTDPEWAPSALFKHPKLGHFRGGTYSLCVGRFTRDLDVGK